MTYKLSDSVSMRLIQIFQEAVLTGVDGADLLRQVLLVPGEDGLLSLDPEYVKSVEKGYLDLVNEVTAKSTPKNIV